jgi:Protein of unknown function, DUF488
LFNRSWSAGLLRLGGELLGLGIGIKPAYCGGITERWYSLDGGNTEGHSKLRRLTSILKSALTAKDECLSSDSLGIRGPMATKALHTIGYEGSSLEDFLFTLNHVGIDLLIDVRDMPISRKKGFSKIRLSQSLERSGVGYLHLKGLGDPKPGRIAAREGRFADFRRIFSTHLRSEPAEEDLALGIEAASNRFACLMCFERDHRNCHRCMVADEMARLGGFRIVHLCVQVGSSSGLTPSSVSTPHAAPLHIG